MNQEPLKEGKVEHKKPTGRSLAVASFDLYTIWLILGANSCREVSWGGELGIFSVTAQWLIAINTWMDKGHIVLAAESQYRPGSLL